MTLYIHVIVNFWQEKKTGDGKDKAIEKYKKLPIWAKNAFIYIQKSQVKYTYILLTTDARKRFARACHSRFLRAEAARVHLGTASSLLGETAEQCALFSIYTKVR